MNRSPQSNEPGFRKGGRLAIILAGLFIILILPGIFGVWLVERRASEIAQKSFDLVGKSAGVVDAGVARVDGLIATSRTVVQQAAETVAAAGRRVAENRPVLKKLTERLETDLTPRIAQMRQALTPVRDAVSAAANAVELWNSLPAIAGRAPRLAALDASFDRLEELSADTTQLRGALRILVETQTSDLTDEPIAMINGLTQRIDTRLVEVQSNVEEVQAEIADLQAGLDARESRVLFIFKLVALLATLMLAWVLYSQVVVIRYHRARVR